MGASESGPSSRRYEYGFWEEDMETDAATRKLSGQPLTGERCGVNVRFGGVPLTRSVVTHARGH
ncbi:MAG: hypothetical protein BRD36_01960 [Bacteroidetes bacterium QH_7_64_110]|nr:MAG: hypothetical protein BRD36_01960 [Bacteroidetes bacterium QH_7_64_110]